MLNAVAKVLAGWGVGANAVTFAGFAVSGAAGLLAARGQWMAAGMLAIGSGVCDLLDGKIARLDPARSKFGALWDSSLDRYSDAFLIAGIGYYFATQGNFVILIAALSAMAGSFEISYVRARAEGLGFECRVGFWERGERWVILVLGLLIMNPAVPVIILAVMTHLTAFRRVLHIRASASQAKQAVRAQSHQDSKWSRPVNWLHAAAAILPTLFWR